MYCPYCCAPLVSAPHGELQCSSMKSLFSQSLRLHFDALVAESPGLSRTPASFDIGRWFCPACGSKTDNGVCASCGVVISSGVARQLVELNPHIP